jgi:DNA-directed RNA polymerase alpha subunit
MDICDLELSARPSGALASRGITTVEQLLKLSYRELEEIRGMGEKSLAEIAWTCLELYRGDALKRCIEWRDSFHPINVKAKKYDEIARIIKG